MKHFLALYVCILLFATACGGGRPALAPDLSPARDTDGAGKAVAVLSAEQIAQLAELSAHPGVSGVDYDPRSITVYYTARQRSRRPC